MLKYERDIHVALHAAGRSRQSYELLLTILALGLCEWTNSAVKKWDGDSLLWPIHNVCVGGQIDKNSNTDTGLPFSSIISEAMDVSPPT